MLPRLIGVCVAFLVGFVIVFMGLAHAKWKPEYGQNSPEIQKWFSTQHNANGEWCCNEADGHRFDGAYGFDKDGNVIAYDDGKEYKIEKYKVLMGHNPTGEAIWWYVDYGSGDRHTYCFSPGSLT